jgi:RecA-family ATPase
MTSTPTPNDLPPLAVSKAASIPTLSARQPWLVRELWTHNAVGLIAGPPKTAKTLLALELAVSVASATPCLGRFEVDSEGPVLVFLAEDALSLTKVRLEALCEHKSLDLDALELHFITAPTLWLDLADDRLRLQQCIARLRPSMLILDPIVRLFRTDESGPRELSRLLGYLRVLQRHFELAVAVIQHSSVEPSPLGHDQRPLISDALTAWADSMLFISNHDGQLRLHVDHRFAPPSDPALLEVVSYSDGLGARIQLASSTDDQGQLTLPLSIVAR